MKKTTIFNSIIMGMAILVLLTIVLNFWKMGEISLSALTLLQSVFFADAKLDLGDSVFMKSLVHQIEIALATPYIAAILIIIFSLLKRRWSYIVTAVLSFVEDILLLTMAFVLIPMKLHGMAEDVTGTVFDIPYVGALVENVAGDALEMTSSESIRSIVVSGLGAAFWISAAVFVMAAAVSVCAFLLTANESEKLDKEVRHASVLCLCGEMAGARIPMESDSELVIGSDEDCCNLVLSVQNVEKLHCRIRYCADQGKYQVTDYSSGGTYVNESACLEQETVSQVERGSRIELGSFCNVFVLD